MKWIWDGLFVDYGNPREVYVGKGWNIDSKSGCKTIFNESPRAKLVRR